MTFPYRLVDLSHELTEKAPTWDGGCGFAIQTLLDYADNPSEPRFCVQALQMHAGIGTHMDAPSHICEGGLSIGDLPLEDLLMQAVVLRVPDAAEGFLLLPEHILAFEAMHGLLPPSCCVLLDTGWGKFWEKPALYRNNLHFPSVSAEAAKLLVQRGIRALGIDTLSPDCADSGYPVHQILLTEGICILENVAHLDKMPEAGAYVLAAPLKIPGATESPIRLIGLIARSAL